MRSSAIPSAAMRQSHFFICAYSLTAKYVRVPRPISREGEDAPYYVPGQSTEESK